ncbi:MAG: hypothetical protein K2Z81_28670, partial [Cyanobacteria bacterium]|nr:hypothetical protein [Cyanobacteriota bacterium]
MSRKKKTKSASGLSIVELCIVITIMGFVSASAFGMVLATLAAGRALENKCDSVSTVRNAIEKFGKDVRMGRTFGDVYGQLTNISGVQVCLGSLTFPSSNDPLYGSGQSPPNGWPTWADGSTPQTFSCDNQTCVVQLPVFDANGFPTGIPGGTLSLPYLTSNVETHVYRLLPDPVNQGEFILQKSIFPGWNQPAGTQRGPITIATGIIGPLNPQTGQPRIFQYLDKTDPSGAPSDSPSSGTPPGLLVTNYSGVIMNLEVRNHAASDRADELKPLALKTEVFLRNNSMATAIG